MRVPRIIKISTMVFYPASHCELVVVFFIAAFTAYRILHPNLYCGLVGVRVRAFSELLGWFRVHVAPCPRH